MMWAYPHCSFSLSLSLSLSLSCTRVAEGAPTNLKKNLLKDAGSTTITYDMKLGVKDTGKLDVRLQFIDKKPKVVQVKKNENKILIFDMMCLNRWFTVRIAMIVSMFPRRRIGLPKSKILLRIMTGSFGPEKFLQLAPIDEIFIPHEPLS